VPASNYDRGVPEFLFSEITAGATPASTALDSDQAITFRDISPRVPVVITGREDGPTVARVRVHAPGGRPATWPPG
jgi:hypothetical protein